MLLTRIKQRITLFLPVLQTAAATAEQMNTKAFRVKGPRKPLLEKGENSWPEHWPEQQANIRSGFSSQALPTIKGE
jgi:hypothetical protein